MRDIFEKTLQHGVRAHTLPIAEMLRERDFQAAYSRLAKVAFYKTVGRTTVRGLVGNFVDNPNFIGAGSEQLVFMAPNGEEVEKVLITSITASRRKAVETAKEHQYNSDLANHYMGEFWVDTGFDITKLRLGNFAVVATQPSINIVNSFDKIEDIWTHKEDPEYRAHHARLLDSVRAYYADTGMLPDFGRGNIVTEDNPCGEETIKIIDTIPEGPRRLARPMLGQREITREQAFRLKINEWAASVEKFEEAA